MIRNLQVIKKAVVDMGGTVEELVPERGCFYAIVLGKRILIERKMSITRQSFVSGELTRCKDITHRLLQAHGLPTPKTESFYNKSYDRNKAEKALASLGYPIILKDAQGSESRGIFPFIGNASEAIDILERELPHFRSMIAQEMVFGKEYRVLVLGEKVIGALEMIPPYVKGDGVSTVREIIGKKQDTTRRRTEFDEGLDRILEEQGVSLEGIMPAESIAYIRRSSCLAEGGETRDVTDRVHGKVGEICVEASKVVGKELVGIDIMCEDISIDPGLQSFNIIEINGKPDLYIHYDPTHGETRNVVEDIVRFMAEIA
jgi:D-alanine-D-alanine ligase-like ATP-grasp enzyme